MLIMMWMAVVVQRLGCWNCDWQVVD